jgi:MFS transporter, ACS family, glucarate transporter
MQTKTPAAGATAAPLALRATRVRYFVLAMLFIATTINYADRASISIAGSAMQKDFGIGAVELGYIFSAFGWSYVIAQLPGGWLLDRFGSRRVYGVSILIWSVFTLLQGTIGFLVGAGGLGCGFFFRFLVGVVGGEARHGVGHLQLRAIRGDGDLRADHGLARAFVRLA